MGANTGPSKSAVYGVYEATKLILEDPENKATYAMYGVGPVSVKRIMLPDHTGGHIGACMRVLLKEGFIQELPDSKRTKRKYILTDKELLAPDAPVASEDALEKDINNLIDSLEKVQEIIPRVLPRLLDVTKSFKKFRKLKELLTNASGIARTNL